MESIINLEKLAYDKDYEKMIKDFKIDEARIKYLNDSRNKLKSLNKKWARSIEKMKETKDLNLINEREKILYKIEKRKDISIKQINQIKEKKSQFLTEIQAKNKDAVQALKDKINYNLKEHSSYSFERIGSPFIYPFISTLSLD